MTFFPTTWPSRLATMALALSVATVYADSSPFQGPEWKLMEPAPVLAAAATITPSAFPNCDQAIVDQRELEVYRADGTGESQAETFTKVLTEKGRRDNAILTLNFLLPYFKVEVTRLEIIKPDGAVRAIDIAANAKEAIDDSQMDANIYDPNARVLRVNVPGLEIGDTVHTVVRNITARPIIPGEFSDDNVFEGPAYIRHSSLEVRGPAAKPLQHVVLRDPVPGTVTPSTRRDHDVMIYHWEINRVPRMYDEPSMPPYDATLQRLFISTLPDWRAVSRWYWQLSAPHLAATTQEMKKTVRKLVAGDQNESAKLAGIFHYVAENIRYMGVTPEHDRPGFEPHDVSLTFDKKYGVCRDKAGLLVAMLRIAGFDAYPVLINIGGKRDPEAPSPDFNHAIVAVAQGPGNYLLMDPTDEHTRGFRPTYDDNRSYLVCRPEGEGLRVSPVSPPQDNLMAIKTEGTLHADGSLSATTRFTFGGVNDDAYRGAFAQMKPDDRRRFFESRLQQVMPGASVQSLDITPENLLDLSAPLEARLTFSVPAAAAFGSGKAIVTMPWIGTRIGLVNYMLQDTGLERRKYPLITDAACGLRENISLTLAPGFHDVLALPAAAKADGNILSYARQFAFDRGRLTATDDFRLKTVEFSPEQYLSLKQTLGTLAYDDRKAPVLAMTEALAHPQTTPAAAAALPPVASDAKLLEDQQKLVVTDAHTAVLSVRYVKKILSYAGKIRESEVKIPFNPATEDARLLRASVTSPTGVRQEISAIETHRMDAGWDSSARRYTGGKLLVANLPGVEIGSTIEVAYQITEHDRPYISGFQAFQLIDAMQQKSFELVAPAGLAVRLRINDPAHRIHSEKHLLDGRQDFIWDVKDTAALPDEQDVPAAWLWQTGVGFFVGDENAYLSDLSRAMLDHSHHGSRAAALAREMAAHGSTQSETARSIRDYVAKVVRLAGPSFGELPLSELSDADTTLTDGYGHAADRAILLHAMLAAVGLKPAIVLVSDAPPVPKVETITDSLLVADAFQMPLVRVVADGKTCYLNDTDQYAPLGATAHDDRVGIELPDGRRDIVRAAAPDHTKVDTFYRLVVGDDGSATLGLEHRYYGMAFDEKNKFFSELTPEVRARYYQQAVSAIDQGAHPKGALVTNFNSYPGTETFAVQIDHYAVANGRFLYLKLPFAPHLLSTGADRRVLPLWLANEDERNVHVDIQWPQSYRQIDIAPVGERLAVPDGAGAAQVVVSATSADCAVNYKFERHPAVLEPAHYPEARRIESTLANPAERMLLLEKNASE
ncbi:MAG TPA: DUF3857 domain-containing protein [Opitutaceae bacterium]|nr:DUF3857 domain-containing protein [Opitutaceae bacterium]